jgi:hypothetical protein
MARPEAAETFSVPAGVAVACSGSKTIELTLACTRSRLDDDSATVLKATASASHSVVAESASQWHWLRAPVCIT